MNEKEILGLITDYLSLISKAIRAPEISLLGVYEDKVESILGQEPELNFLSLRERFLTNNYESFFDDSIGAIVPITHEKKLIGILWIKNSKSSRNVFLKKGNIFFQLLPHLSLLVQYFMKSSRENLFRARLLNQLKKNKKNQDADYFLISILLDALQVNQNSNNFIQTDFFIEQYKKFRFRKWKGDIGGDLCKTDLIYLNDGHSYTVFLNGDAMGKSIQGAGGAIVLGVIFEAILSRVKQKRKKNYNYFPETWLKETYLDIQSVFLSFQGLMLASFCLGLIHSETGSMYFINVEHPMTILYRNKTAIFIEDIPGIPKAGIPGKEELFSIKCFQLLDGDSIFTGSDGKDDLICGLYEDGTQMVQDDENLILKVIEESKGDLQLIKKNIKNYGKLRDDLSLLKVDYKVKHSKKKKGTYPDGIVNVIKEAEFLYIKEKYDEIIVRLLSLENYIEIEPDLARLLGKIYYYNKDYLKSVELYEYYSKINPNDNLFIVSDVYLELLKVLAKTYARTHQCENAIEILEEYLYSNPSSNEMLYELSQMYKEIKNYEKAADVGERLYLRDTKNFDNLINLSQIYLFMKVHDRANQMIEKALLLKPDSSSVREIYERMKNTS